MDSPKMPVLPVEAYTTAEWFAQEMRYLFSNTWQFAGFPEDLAEPGQFMAVQAGFNNIFIVKGRDHRLRAFHNICRHRGTQLLRAAGKTQKAITCPYHDWTYDLEGRLISVPEKETEFPDLDMENCGLHQASVDIWRNMIFVHPSPNAPSVIEWFDPVEAYLGPHQPEKLVEFPDTSTEHIVHANWKIVVENYIDGYHLPHLHSKTLNMYDHSKIQCGFQNNHFWFYEPLIPEFQKNVDKYAPTPVIDHIPQEQMGAYVPMLFPNLGLAESESSWSVFLVIPLAPDKTKVVTRTRFMPASEWEFQKQQSRSWSFFSKIMGSKVEGDPKADPLASGDFMAEDVLVCEQQQKSLQSPYFSVGATAKNLESSVRDYQSNIQTFIEKARAESL